MSEMPNVGLVVFACYWLHQSTLLVHVEITLLTSVPRSREVVTVTRVAYVSKWLISMQGEWVGGVKRMSDLMRQLRSTHCFFLFFFSEMKEIIYIDITVAGSKYYSMLLSLVLAL